ncbi:hypothetical protein R6Q59_019204 [Mikania micrantha]
MLGTTTRQPASLICSRQSQYRHTDVFIRVTDKKTGARLPFPSVFVVWIDTCEYLWVRKLISVVDHVYEDCDVEMVVLVKECKSQTLKGYYNH